MRRIVRGLELLRDLIHLRKQGFLGNPAMSYALSLRPPRKKSP